MSYILSLLKSELLCQLPRQVSPSILCYYTNHTVEIQIIRIERKSAYYFERVVFPKERVLFEAALESYLEIHSPFPDGDRITRLECRLFQVYER
jgi:hypothetical protein